ncbi:hypothetical protein ACFY4C_40355 [Actinomadura viridis]|uniref:hypothetical protein n=1 Tax=Actinomadura viridis TaxID=58110 RepID=UPI00368C1446
MNIRSKRVKARVAMLAAVPAVAASAVVVGTATPALAACGQVGGSFTHKDKVSRVEFTAVKNCSNNDVRVYGRLYDTLNDSRSVRLDIKYGGGTFGNDFVRWAGGYNTSTPFDHNAGDTGSYVELCMFAYNSFGQSATDCEPYYF